MQTIRILIVEDEFVIANNLQQLLQRQRTGPVGLAFSVTEALALIDEDRPDLVLTDIMLQGERSGIELGQLLHAQYKIPFIYVTSHADKSTLQHAIATQPVGYILKPFQPQEVIAAIKTGLAHIGQEQAPPVSESAPAVAAAIPGLGGIVGQAPAMQHVLGRLRQVAPHDLTTLLLGETGTGKELFARAIHELSPRHRQPLVTVNCAALPAQLTESELFGHEKGAFTGAHERRIGKFELADGGTIFLDEIGELPLELQAKLLRVLQEKEVERLGSSSPRPVNVRILAATNRNLTDEVAAGRFRADLYYRLHVLTLQIPPLRERPEDIPLLAELFLQRAARELKKPVTGFSEVVSRELQRHPWPGNVRELQHRVESATLFATGPLIEQLELEARPTPPAAAPAAFVPRTLEDAERELIRATLRHCGGRIRGAGGAAEYLNILPNTLDARLRRLGIEKNFE